MEPARSLPAPTTPPVPGPMPVRGADTPYVQRSSAPARPRRPHPARTARRVSGLASVAGMLSLAGYLAAAHVASAGSDRSGSSTFAGGQNTVATGSNASSASSAVGATDNGATSVTVPPGYGWAGNNAGGGVSSSHGS